MSAIPCGAWPSGLRVLVALTGARPTPLQGRPESVLGGRFHGTLIDASGYHCRDYFLAQWDKFKGYPGGVLAHSTHVKGQGQYDASAGKETPRIEVTLATALPKKRCRRLNLGYLDPATLQRQDGEGQEDEGILVVPRAGEMLYRVRQEPLSPLSNPQ